MARTATRTVLAVVRMVVRDYTTAERREEARDGGFPVSEIGRLSQYSARDIAEGLEATECNEEAYAGSGVFLKIESVSVERAAFDTIPHGWSPIDTVLKRRCVEVDLVLLDRKTGGQWREPNCHWTSDRFGWADRSGRSVCGRRYYDDAGRECYDPVCEDEQSVVATHWAPTPTLPARSPDPWK